MSRIVENAIYKTSEKFRARIMELMDEYELPSNQLFADYFGISVPVIRKAREYGTFPTLRILIKMADKFDFSLLYLMGEINTNNFTRKPDIILQWFNGHLSSGNPISMIGQSF